MNRSFRYFPLSVGRFNLALVWKPDYKAQIIMLCIIRYLKHLFCGTYTVQFCVGKINEDI